ncbi:MAG: hypothetical protein JKX74_05655 [Flavobacteriales bacterium]|nr:hypothetical protein [Flavobacteriales bacterium]
MENNGEILFEEKQYLGYNRYSNLRRFTLGLFCFMAYFWQEEHNGNGELLFAMGIVILAISVILMFVLHLHTKVTDHSIVLDGLWTSKRVKIDLGSIVSAKAVPSRRFLLSRPVYNLHWKGAIKFYCRGKEGVELVDRDGMVYIIGSQMSGQLAQLLQDLIGKNGKSTSKDSAKV